MKSLEQQPMSEDKKSYIDNKDKLAALKAKPVEDLSMEEFKAVKEAKQANEGLVDKAQEEAGAEELEREVEKEGKIYDEAKAQDEAFEQKKAAESALQLAEDARVRAAEDAEAAAKVLVGIQGEKIGGDKSQEYNIAEDKERSEGTDPRLEKYMGTIREALKKIKELHAENFSGKYNSNMSQAERQMRSGEDSEGKNFLDLPIRKDGESDYRYTKRVDKARDDFNELTRDNEEIALALIETKRMGIAWSGGLIGVSERLLGDKKFIKEALRLLKKNINKDSPPDGWIWRTVRGEAAADRDLYIEAVKLNPLNYQYGPNKWKSDPEIQKVALESGLDSAYLYKQAA